MKNFDGIIFDIDGTLTSTNELIFASFNHIADKYLNKTFTDEEIIAMFGPPEDDIIKQLMNEKYELARKDYFDFYHSQHNSMADLYPGIKDLLDKIKNEKIQLGIFTGKGKDAASITLKVLEIYSYFDFIVTGDDVVEHKPSPEGIKMFLDKFNLDKEKVLLIGDAPADIKAAHAAGIKIASVVWDSYAKEKVIELNSDFVFHTVEDLEKFISENIK